MGIGRNVHLTTVNWAMVKREGGFAIWQAQIHSAAAFSLQVRFSDFDLEPGMSVKVYGLGGGVGAPVREYAGRGLGDGGKFWSLSVHGDTVVVEYWLPAELEMRPADFPFKVERISHRFRDEEGKLSGMNVRRFLYASCRDYTFCSDDLNYPEARGVANYEFTNNDGRVGTCSGALLNNEKSDDTLYFLTAFHCIDGIVGSSGAEANGTYISAKFMFYDDSCSRTKPLTGKNARFVAGSVTGEGDWALLRIEGKVTDGNGREGGLYFQGWNSRSLEGHLNNGFIGYILHHPRGGPISFTRFDSDSLENRDRGVFNTCSGSRCSHFEYSLDRATYSGSSGAPLFYDFGDGDVLVGVHTGGSRYDCGEYGYKNIGWGARFSKMWEDERLRGALTYGKNYDPFTRGQDIRLRLKALLGGAIR